MSGTRSRASFSGPSSSATTTSRLVHVKTALKEKTIMNQKEQKWFSQNSPWKPHFINVLHGRGRTVVELHLGALLFSWPRRYLYIQQDHGRNPERTFSTLVLSSSLTTLISSCAPSSPSSRYRSGGSASRAASASRPGRQPRTRRRGNLEEGEIINNPLIALNPLTTHFTGHRVLVIGLRS